MGVRDVQEHRRDLAVANMHICVYLCIYMCLCVRACANICIYHTTGQEIDIIALHWCEAEILYLDGYGQ